MATIPATSARVCSHYQCARKARHQGIVYTGETVAEGAWVTPFYSCPEHVQSLHVLLAKMFTTHEVNADVVATIVQMVEELRPDQPAR